MNFFIYLFINIAPVALSLPGVGYTLKPSGKVIFFGFACSILTASSIIFSRISSLLEVLAINLIFSSDKQSVTPSVNSNNLSYESLSIILVLGETIVIPKPCVTILLRG